MPEAPTPSEAVLTWVSVLFTALLAGAASVSGLEALQARGLWTSGMASLMAPAMVTQAVVLGMTLLWIRMLHLRAKKVSALTGSIGIETYVYGALLLIGLIPIAGVTAEFIGQLVGTEGVLELTERATQTASAGEFALALVLLSVVPGFCEEFLFRGYMMSAFTARSAPMLGLVVTSVLFGCLHLDPAQSAGTLILGLGLGAIRLASSSLWPCVVAHAVHNAMVLLAVRFQIENVPVLALMFALIAGGVGLWKTHQALPAHT